MTGEHDTVVGVCEKVEITGDWYAFLVKTDGSDYPLKITTKKPEMIELGKAIGQQKAEWGFLKTQGNENKNRPGTYYTNRYLDSVKVLDEVEDSDPAVTPAMPHPAELPDAPPPAVDWDAKDLRRHRQAAVAIAVSRAAQLKAPETVDIYAMAEDIVSFVYRRIEYVSAETLFLDADGNEIPFE